MKRNRKWKAAPREGNWKWPLIEMNPWTVTVPRDETLNSFQMKVLMLVPKPNDPSSTYCYTVEFPFRASSSLFSWFLMACNCNRLKGYAGNIKENYWQQLLVLTLIRCPRYTVGIHSVIYIYIILVWIKWRLKWRMRKALCIDEVERKQNHCNKKAQ
jgi:hypothetical protein